MEHLGCSLNVLVLPTEVLQVNKPALQPLRSKNLGILAFELSKTTFPAYVYRALLCVYEVILYNRIRGAA